MRLSDIHEGQDEIPFVDLVLLSSSEHGSNVRKGNSSGDENIGQNTCYVKFLLQVQDFGCGISSDKLDSLFINFGTLAEHQKNNPSGRGLGLSICKSIVEKMGGNVSVESVVGEGTKFNLTFKTVSHLSSSKQQEES